MSDTLPPLPDFSPSFRPRWLSDNGGFTADQMRSYASAAVAAECERWVKLLEERAHAWRGSGDYRAGMNCAAQLLRLDRSK
jgi:hypothetical protein